MQFGNCKIKYNKNPLEKIIDGLKKLGKIYNTIFKANKNMNKFELNI